MNEKKETIEEHHENEEITPDGEIKGPEISPDVIQPDESSEGQVTDKLKADLAEMNDKFLRLYSEFDNYRKRTQKERLEMLKSAGADVITNLLSVLDDFERALKYAEQSENSSTQKEGVELIFNKMKSVLEGRGLKRMNSIGEVFNDDFHEAIANIPAPAEDLKGKVVDESECGYFLGEKVIRHAKVIVGI